VNPVYYEVFCQHHCAIPSKQFRLVDRTHRQGKQRVLALGTDIPLKINYPAASHGVLERRKLVV